MKAILFLALGLAASAGIAQSTRVSTKSTTSTTINSSAMAVSKAPASALPSAQVHFLTNIVGLVQSQPNIQAHFFGMPQVALTIGFMSASETGEPLRRTTSSRDITVNKTQYSVGGAYYFSPTENQMNMIVNPFLITQKKSDVVDVDNNIGLGISALGMYRANNFSLTFGGQSAFVASETIASVNAGIGFMY